LKGAAGKVTGGVYRTLKAVWLLRVPQAPAQFAVGVVIDQFTPAFLGSFATTAFSVTGTPPALIFEILLVMVAVKPGTVTLNTAVSPFNPKLTEVTVKKTWLMGKGGVAGAVYVTENGAMFVSVPMSFPGVRLHVTPFFAESPVTVALKTTEVPCGMPPGLFVILTPTFGSTPKPRFPGPTPPHEEIQPRERIATGKKIATRMRPPGEL